MDRQQFHLLLKRYVENQSTAEELQFIHHWYELLGNEPLQELNAEDALEAEDRIWKKIQENLKPATIAPIKKISIKWLAIAASLLLIVGLSIDYLYNNQQSENLYTSISGNDYKECSNLTKDELSVCLEDSSIVMLKKGSSLKYPIHFPKNKREVYLKGEAFFEVSKNAKRPFYVYSNNIVTHVLGTSFTVKPSLDGKHTEVEVKTGRVEVYENNGAKSNKGNTDKGVVLLPNQKVIYSEKESVFETTLVEDPQQVVNVNKDTVKVKFVLDDEPLSEIIKKLEAMYGIEIVLENDNINNCRFTGNIEKPNLYGKLDLICQSINATYEIKGTKILIRGKGCN